MNAGYDTKDYDRMLLKEEQRAVAEAMAKTCRECRMCRVTEVNGEEVGFCLQCEEFIVGVELDTTIYDACGEEPCD